MPILRIEHSVPDFAGWKRAEFDTLDEAEGLLATMRRVWSGEGQKVMRNPQARIVEKMEVIKL